MANYAWLWLEDSGLSDFRLDVLPADDGADHQPLYSLNLQSVVLATASPGHFRGHCIRGKQEKLHIGPESTATEQPQDAAPAPLHSKAPPGATDLHPGHVHVHIHIQPAGPAYSYRLTLFPEEPEGVPKAVLCHLYTGALPDDPEQLIWMLRRADYLDLADTVHAVLQKLISVGSKQLTLQHAALLSAVPHLQCGARQGAPAIASAAAAGQAAAAGAVPAPAPPATAAAQLQQLIDSLLLPRFTSAPAIARDATLLAKFSQLPLALVRRWVELDKYKVDSGNTLAVLFTAWHDAQPEPPSEEQCKQLSALLPLSAVSYGFHCQALQHLKWWRPPASPSGDFLSLHMLVEQSSDEVLRKHWETEAGGQTVAKRASKSATHTWTVTAEQLKQLWQDKRFELPVNMCFAGYSLGANLQLRHDSEDREKTGPVYLGVFRTTQWPKALDNHTSLRVGCGDVISSTLTWGLPHLNKKGTFTADVWWGGWGWPKVDSSISFSSLESLVPTPTAEFTLKCEVRIGGKK